MKLLRLEHLNSEEYENVKLLVYNYADRFYLPGERLEKTHATSHRIYTTDEISVHTKQYRFPQIHKDGISTSQ